MTTTTLLHDFGTFEGFNFRDDAAIDRTLRAAELASWDHDARGEAEFWPAGDHEGIGILFRGRTSITFSELAAVDRLLQELGDDSTVNYLRIVHAIEVTGTRLEELGASVVEDQFVHVFTGTHLIEVRQNAAYELFQLYYPEAYRVWEASHCDGLIFDTERFLDSPAWSVNEIKLRDGVALLVAPA